MERRAHWESISTTKSEDEVSWVEEMPGISLDFIRATGVGKNVAILDVGGGAFRHADVLLDKGYKAITVLDLSEQALAVAKARLEPRASGVQWIAADITTWEPESLYDVWHDRAVFHLLLEQADRYAYLVRLLKGLRPGGHLIIGTFALDGPERCSGLPVVRYDAQSLGEALGPDFELVETRNSEHHTPDDRIQRFQFSWFRRVP
jgi:SAM-dependent methyltransferase